MEEMQPKPKKRKKRTYQKPLSLYGQTFEQAVDRVLKYKPKAKKK
jgi:hypothetical protein